jgi:hypothetical protein
MTAMVTNPMTRCRLVGGTLCLSLDDRITDLDQAGAKVFRHLGRPATTAAVAAALGVPATEVQAVVDRLTAEGHLVPDGPHPAETGR